MNRALLAAALLMCSALLSGAQQAPVVRPGAGYLPIDVVVTDEHDVPLVDLTASEFEISEGGRRQAVADFKFVSIPVAARDLGVAGPQSVVTDVAFNGRRSVQSRLFVLLIDDLHTSGRELAAVRKVMTDFVRALSPDDEVAVVFVGRPDLNLNFTSDIARMANTIERTREAFAFGADAPGPPSDDARGQDGSAMMSQGRAVALAFKNMAQVLAGSTHQRRAIVYVSGGPPIDLARPTGQTKVVMEELSAAFEAVRRAGVPIYSLGPVSPIGVVQSAEGVMSMASVSTGGRAFVSQPELAGAVNAIVKENGSFYLIGYSPASAPGDGRFHPIEVKVTRPGARVRARAGYMSVLAEASDSGERLAAAMSSSIDVRGLTLRAHVAPLLPFEKVMRSTVTIQVTYPTVASDLPFDSVRVQVAAIDTGGKVRASSDRNYTFKAPQSQRESATFLIDGAIDLPAQPLTLRIGVSSRALGRTGTVHVPVTVPQPADAHLQMGAVVIGLTGPARESALGDALVRDLVPFQPTTTRQFSQRSTLRVFAPFFWREPEGVVTVTLTLKSEGFVLRREESLTGAAAGDPGRRLAALDTLIPLAKLAGPITLEVEGRLANGQSTRQSVGFEVRVPTGRLPTR